MITAEAIINLLNLEPLPGEGGYFVETYRADDALPAGVFKAHNGGPRAVSTAIYYLLTSDTFSAMHRITSDEIFHFYLGDPVEMLQLKPDGSGGIVTIGADILAGMRPQVVVPAGVWQGVRLALGGDFALMGTTVAPGFDYEDFELGSRASLTASHPEFREMIETLTR